MRLDEARRRARRRALGLYRSAGFRTAYVNGALARAGGLGLDSCPYPADPARSWRNAYRKAWLRGWRSA